MPRLGIVGKGRLYSSFHVQAIFLILLQYNDNIIAIELIIFA
jgi:DNA-binding transcriptional regulator of glucitol operon